MLKTEDRVIKSTQQLIESIIESSDYQNFIKIRDRVREDPELRRKINDFRRHNFEVQNMDGQMRPDLYEAIEELGERNRTFREDPLVDEFLRQELHVCRMIQQINRELVLAVDLDLDDVVKGLHS